MLLPNPGLRITSGQRRLASHDKGLLAVKVHIGKRTLWFATVHVFPFHVFKRDAREPAFGMSGKSLPTQSTRLATCPCCSAAISTPSTANC